MSGYGAGQDLSAPVWVQLTVDGVDLCSGPEGRPAKLVVAIVAECLFLALLLGHVLLRGHHTAGGGALRHVAWRLGDLEVILLVRGAVGCLCCHCV